MKTWILAVSLMLSLGLSLRSAAIDSADIPELPRDTDMDAARQAIRKSEWKVAIDHLQRVAAREPRNADARNLLGYTHRKSGNLEQAFRHYYEALKLEPDHRGAHEYIGEAYLMKGDLAKAEEHLKALDRICTLSCEEFRDLRSSIENYKRAKK